jgi:lysophospholipase L1-like esterase
LFTLRRNHLAAIKNERATAERLWNDLLSTKRNTKAMMMKTNRIGLALVALALALSAQAFAEEVPAPLLGVQRIVFLGDSITQGGDYVTDFDCWLISRGIHIEVLNLGLASESATDLTEAENAGHKKSFGFGRPLLSERLDRVLAATKPDLLIACYGMNDGGSLPADQAGTERFAAAITHLRDKALKAGVKRVVLCTPPPHDAKGNASQQAHDENLTRYTKWLLSKKAAGWEVVDIHGPMRQALDEGRAKDPQFALAGDGVHPGREGHWLMATAILAQFLGADLDGVSSAEQLFKRNGTEIRKLVHTRMTTLHAAWMTEAGHTRPGVPGGPGTKPGLPIVEANLRAAELTKQIAGLQGK